MNILIPMAGSGKRFSDAGYKMIKPLIDLWGRPMALRVLDSLGLHGNFIFVIRTFEGYEKLVSILKDTYPCEIVILHSETDGPARTCLAATDYINNNEELVIANCDQIMHWQGSMFRHFCSNTQGTVVTYNSTRPQNSYAKLAKDGTVVQIAEKKVISNVSLVGIHYWAHGIDFVRSAHHMINADDRAPNGEFYVAPTYNYMLRTPGTKVHVYHLPDGAYNSVGSPEDLYSYIEKVQPNASTSDK